jgi:hypothetical protein
VAAHDSALASGELKNEGIESHGVIIRRGCDTGGWSPEPWAPVHENPASQPWVGSMSVGGSVDRLPGIGVIDEVLADRPGPFQRLAQLLTTQHHVDEGQFPPSQDR